MSASEPLWETREPGWDAISHATVKEQDFDRLADVERLTLTNVKLPRGFLARLGRLWWLDIRGGSAFDLHVAAGCLGLRGLAVSQVRGLESLSAVSGLPNLEMLSVYGQSRVRNLPDLSRLDRLKHVRLGQMIALTGWAPLAEVTHLEEVELINKVDPDAAVIAALASHPELKTFCWFGPDVVRGKASGAMELINKPVGRMLPPEQWFYARAPQAD